MKDTIFGVYGVSGLGREVIPLAREQLKMQDSSKSNLVFIDDNVSSSNVNGYKVLSYAEFLAVPADERYVSLAIANSSVREKLAIRCRDDGIRVWSIKANNVVVMDDVQLGEGAILSPFVTLTSNIKIGNFFHANIYSYVAHDCVIGDYVTFAPGVKCNGNIVIEDHAYIGTGVILKQGKPNRPLVIGTGAKIGMGSVVTKSVPPNTTVFGNPARLLAKGSLI